jgi:hypothetical protein
MGGRGGGFDSMHTFVNGALGAPPTEHFSPDSDGRLMLNWLVFFFNFVLMS